MTSETTPPDAPLTELERTREQLLMMTRQRDLLRRGHLVTREVEIRAAIADPGSVLPRLHGAESIPSWCARAVVALLGGTQGQADEPDRYSLAAAREEGYEPDPDPDYGKDLDDEDDPTLATAW